MRRFTITIENEIGDRIYSEYAYGEDENEVLTKLLGERKVLISAGDKILIEEVYRPVKLQWD